MTDFNIRDTQSLPLIIESIARRVVAVERRSPQYTEAVSVVEVQDLDSRPDPEGPDTYCYVVLTADWYETSPNGFLPPPNPPIPVYQWITSTGPPAVPPAGIPDPLLLSDGTAGAPTYSFASDPDTGMYLPTANQLGFAAGGVELLRVGSADVDVMTGHLNLISNTGAQTMSLGEWSSGFDYAAVETPSMVLLMGNALNVNSQGFMRTKGTGSLNLGTNNSNDLTIANGGKVGIGTASPVNTLSVGTAANIGSFNVHASKGVDSFTVTTNVVKSENIRQLTTASAASVGIDATTGIMYRLTSALKYKTDVETMADEYADAILDLRPVWYKSLGPHDPSDWGYWGLIAEEVAAVDPRLVHYGVPESYEPATDAEGEPVGPTAADLTEPEGVQYERFVPHLINLVARQRADIEELRKRLAVLEAEK